MKRILCFSLTIFLCFSNSAYSEEDDVKIDPETQKAINRGLEWLASQQKADGSFGDGQFSRSPAITSFALLAFLAQGHLPNQGKYGPEVAKAGRFLVANAREDGCLGKPNEGSNGPMYGHGLALLALTQLYGMTGDDELKKTIKRGAELSIRAQAPNGGWRYQVTPTDHDISVTIGQVMALRGAKNAGINIPDKTMKKALAYIDSCYDASSHGYNYQPNMRQPGFARTAAGICVVKLTGQYDKNVDKSVKYLMRVYKSDRNFYLYGYYYASHAMYQVGGKDWAEFYKETKTDFLRSQDANGAWSRRIDNSPAGGVYQTSVAIIGLSVPAHYLPIFQR